MTFDRERAAALERVSSLSTASKTVAGALALTGVVVGALTGDLRIAAVPLVAFGLFALFIWRRLERRRRAVRGAVERATQPDLWFTSNATGLFFADQHGIFVESELRFFDFAPTQVQRFVLDSQGWRTHETHLTSISYEEAQHAIKLQLVGHFVGDNTGQEHSSVVVPLPSNVAADAALKFAIEANRRSARAA